MPVYNRSTKFSIIIVNYKPCQLYSIYTYMINILQLINPHINLEVLIPVRSKSNNRTKAGTIYKFDFILHVVTCNQVSDRDIDNNVCRARSLLNRGLSLYSLRSSNFELLRTTGFPLGWVTPRAIDVITAVRSAHRANANSHASLLTIMSD